MCVLFVMIFLLVPNRSIQSSLDDLKFSLIRTIDFIGEKYTKFGFDGVFGLTLAEGEFRKIFLVDSKGNGFKANFIVKNLLRMSYSKPEIHCLHNISASALHSYEAQLRKLVRSPLDPDVKKEVHFLINKSSHIKGELLSQLPTHPQYMITFRNELLNSNKWSETLSNVFSYGKIIKFEIYKDWTIEKVLQQKRAIYKGIESDFCLREILEMPPSKGYCYVSHICAEMMLDVFRIDTGYLLTHRLLYLQIQRLQGCILPEQYAPVLEYTRKFCTYIYKEARTNEFLGYPYHDIFLEQVLLCGMEGYAEFLTEEWITEIMKWQNSHGCYESIARNVSKRTSSVIDYGCSDHSTGLGAAVIALYFRYVHTRSLPNPNITVFYQK